MVQNTLKFFLGNICVKKKLRIELIEKIFLPYLFLFLSKDLKASTMFNNFNFSFKNTLKHFLFYR